jgi:hypothetical protein
VVSIFPSVVSRESLSNSVCGTRGRASVQLRTPYVGRFRHARFSSPRVRKALQIYAHHVDSTATPVATRRRNGGRGGRHVEVREALVEVRRGVLVVTQTGPLNRAHHAHLPINELASAHRTGLDGPSEFVRRPDPSGARLRGHRHSLRCGCYPSLNPGNSSSLLQRVASCQSRRHDDRLDTSRGRVVRLGRCGRSPAPA